MGDQPAQFTEEYCAEKMKIIALLIALLVAVAASSEISGDSNERVVPEESLVSEGYHFNPGNYGNTVAKGYFAHPPLLGHHKIVKKHVTKVKKLVKKHVSKIAKKHVKSVKNLFSKVKGLAKKGKKGAIKKLIKKHVRKLKRRVNKHAKRHHKSLVKKHVKSVKNLFSKVKRLAKKGKKGAIKKLIKKHVRKLKRRVNKHVKWHFRRGRSSRRSRRSSRQRGTKWECSWNHNPWFPCTPRPGDVVVPPYNGYWTKRHRKRSMKRRRL